MKEDSEDENSIVGFEIETGEINGEKSPKR